MLRRTDKKEGKIANRNEPKHQCRVKAEWKEDGICEISRCKSTDMMVCLLLCSGKAGGGGFVGESRAEMVRVNLKDGGAIETNV
jgi:hypothetical protein